MTFVLIKFKFNFHNSSFIFEENILNIVQHSENFEYSY